MLFLFFPVRFLAEGLILVLPNFLEVLGTRGRGLNPIFAESRFVSRDFRGLVHLATEAAENRVSLAPSSGRGSNTFGGDTARSVLRISTVECTRLPGSYRNTTYRLV
jgi:hypothetical protein